MKTPRGRSQPIKWCAVFPLWGFGEATEEVSGTQGPWKEIPHELCFFIMSLRAYCMPVPSSFWEQRDDKVTECGARQSKLPPLLLHIEAP
jgi:hypothetical protein